MYCVHGVTSFLGKTGDLGSGNRVLGKSARCEMWGVQAGAMRASQRPCAIRAETQRHQSVWPGSWQVMKPTGRHRDTEDVIFLSPRQIRVRLLTDSGKIPGSRKHSGHGCRYGTRQSNHAGRDQPDTASGQSSCCTCCPSSRG
jgi:hypothetical protein